MANRFIISFVSAVAFLLSPLLNLVANVGVAIRDMWGDAFPAQATRERLPLSDFNVEAVTYGQAKARTQSFQARIASRDHERQNYGALGLAAGT